MSTDDIRRMHESTRAAWNEAAGNYPEYIGDMDLLPHGGTTLQPVGWRTWATCAAGAGGRSTSVRFRGGHARSTTWARRR
jgi:hypothetical protein